MAFVNIPEVTDDAVIDLALDTIAKGKQALVFVNSKRSAEKTAEDIARQIKTTQLTELGDVMLNALPKPTKQCERLSNCIKKGVAFHHAGLVHKQKDTIEDEFRSGRVKVICCTPSLAYGVSTPAFRTIIKDLRRYGNSGLVWIPVLEYQQQAGRAGRPEWGDTFGEAICIAANDNAKAEIVDRYVNGEVEEIYSKLAVEPVLRTYILSLIATGFIKDSKELLDFFSKTFYAHQFKDMAKIRNIISRMTKLLVRFRFIDKKGENEKDVFSDDESDEDFVSASNLDDQNQDADRDYDNEFVSGDRLDKNETIQYHATLVGQRVAQLYIDPLTANYLITNIRKDKKRNVISFLQLVSHTLELRPLLNVKSKEIDDVNEFLLKNNEFILETEPEMYEDEHDEFLCSIKTTMFFYDWINEKDEEFLLEKYNIRPGEIKVKLDIADWLLYSLEELCRLLKMQKIVTDIVKLRLRLEFGVKEELLGLLKLKGIGRVRARKLFFNKIKTIEDVKKADLMKLMQILGRKIAIDIKEQVGEKVDPDEVQVKENKRKGQVSLKDY